MAISDVLSFSQSYYNGPTIAHLAPTGVQVGDFLEMRIMVNGGGTTTATPPAGWTQHVKAPRNTGFLYVFWKVATQADVDLSAAGGTYAITTANQSGVQLVWIGRYTGVDPTTPFDVAATTNAGQSYAAGAAPNPFVITYPAITPVTDGAVVRHMVFGRSGLISFNGVSWADASLTPVWNQAPASQGKFAYSAKRPLSSPPATAPSGTATVTPAASPTSATDWAAVSTVLRPAPTGAPVNTAAPVVSGTAAVGATLAVDNGAWSNSPTSYAYQWRKDGVAISGATLNTYVVQSGDAGSSITATVTATNGGGSSSQASNAVAIPAAPTNTTLPSIATDGTPATGETVTCDPGVWTGTGITYAYQWYRGISPLTGQTGATYTLQPSDEGANITCNVTATNGGGSASASSPAIVPAVTAPLSDDSFLWYYSGGTGNTDPALSIGGARGGTIAAGLSTLFADVPGAVAELGGEFYRVVYVRNTHTTQTATAMSLFVEEQPTDLEGASAGSHHAGLDIAVAVAAEPVDTPVAALASGSTPPAGVTFTTSPDAAGGQALGDLGPGQYRGVYVRMTVAAGTVATAEADFVVAAEGSAP